MSWKELKQDLKERFLNNETFKGVVYLVIAVLLFNPSLLLYILQGFLLYEGLRKVFVNRIKQAKAKKQLEKQREILDEGE